MLHCDPLRVVFLALCTLLPTRQLLSDEEQGLAVAKLERTSTVDFQKEILPILQRSCLACHNQTDAESDLVLESPELILKGGVEGPATVAGNPEESLLFRLASHRDEPIMPPEDNDVSAKNLSPDELGLLALWIKQGATGELRAQRDIQWQSVAGRLNPIYSVAITSQGNHVAAARGNQIHVYHVPTKTLFASLVDESIVQSGVYAEPTVAHLDMIQAIAFSRDGQRLASSGFRNVKIWERSREPSVMSLLEPLTSQEITALATDTDRGRLAIGTVDGRIHVVDQATGDLVSQCQVANAGIEHLEFGTDGTRLLSTDQDGTVCQFDVTSGKESLRSVVSPPAGVIQFVGSGQLAIAANDTIVLRSLDGSMPDRQLKGHSGAVSAVDWCPTQPDQLITGSQDGTVRVWNVSTLQVQRELNHGKPITDVALSPDATRIITIADGSSARLWDAASGKQLAELKGGHYARQRVAEIQQEIELAKKRVANAKSDLDQAKKEKEQADQEATKAQEELKKAADEIKAKTELATKAGQSQQESKKALEMAQQSVKDAEQRAADAAKALESANDAERDAIRQAKDEADKMVASSKEALKKAEEQNKKAVEAAKKAGDEVAAAERKQEGANRELQRSERAVKRTTDAIPVAEQSVAEEEKLQTNFESQLAPYQQAAEASHAARRGVFSNDSRLLAIATANDEVEIFASESGSPIHVAKVPRSIPKTLRFGADSQLMIATTDKDVVRLPIWPQWRLEQTIGSPDSDEFLVDRVTSLAFSPDGSMLATGGGEPSRSGELKLWNVSDGTLIRSFADAHSDTVLGLEFSRDGKWLATSASDRFVKVFDVATGELSQSFEGHTNHVLGVAWRADGRLLASCGADNVVKVWDFHRGEQKKTVTGFSKEVTAIDYLGLEDRFVVSSGDKKIVAKTSDGGGGASYGGADSFMYTARTSANGEFVTAGGHDSVLRVWKKDGTSVAAFPPPSN